jgi:hypothetical protein
MHGEHLPTEFEKDGILGSLGRPRRRLRVPVCPPSGNRRRKNLASVYCQIDTAEEPDKTLFMGQRPRTVLVIGTDDSLLNTRARILRDVANIVSAHPDQAEVLLRTGMFDLVLICQSISAEAKARILALVRGSSPEMRFLNFVKASLPELKLDEDEVVVPVDPRQLIFSVTSLLAEG